VKTDFRPTALDLLFETMANHELDHDEQARGIE
jgi:hypothetical protein